MARTITPRPRESSAKRGYGRDWRRARVAFLAEQPNRICVICKAAIATEVDHVTPHRGDWSLFWDRANWQPVCKSCHSRKTSSGK